MSAKALVVDDEPQILMIIKFALETAGITVIYNSLLRPGHS